MYFIDQLKNEVQLAMPPRRIISIVPSQTELLYHFGLDEQVVGITKFCIHPKEWFKSKTKIGGTKKLNLEKIKSLNPDLIIGNKEENTKEQILELQKNFPVWMSDIYNLDDSFNMMSCLGEIFQKEDAAIQLMNQIKNGFASIPRNVESATVLYLIWNEPFIAVGKSTFIDDMLSKAGFRNVITESRYPGVNIEIIQNLKPEFVFLSSEPFPFAEKHRTIIQDQLPNSKVILVDGEMFSWYGNRLLKAVDYFKGLHKSLLFNDV